MGRKRVQAANKATAEKLRAKLVKTYSLPLPPSASSLGPSVAVQLKDDSQVVLEIFTKLPEGLKDWVFELFETNMKSLYEQSNVGYDREEKYEELFHPESRFIILRRDLSPALNDLSTPSLASPSTPTPIAFSMFRFDTEKTATAKFAEVLYCYEVQVDPGSKRLGLGRVLVDALICISKDWSFDKVMLTAFKANEGAVKFYKHLGFEEDEISPTPEEEEDYEILSKRTN